MIKKAAAWKKEQQKKKTKQIKTEKMNEILISKILEKSTAHALKHMQV